MSLKKIFIDAIGIGKAAYESVLGHFTLDKTISKIGDFYLNLLENV